MDLSCKRLVAREADPVDRHIIEVEESIVGVSYWKVARPGPGYPLATSCDPEDARTVPS